MMGSTVLLASNTSWYLYNFRRSTIKAFQASGVRIICLCPYDRFSRRLVNELGVLHISLSLEGKSTKFAKEFLSFFYIRKVLKEYKPDFVFNFTIKMNIYAGLACIMEKTPFANNVSGLGTAFIHETWLFRGVRKLYGFVNRRASRLFFQNEQDLAVFQRAKLLGEAPVTVLPGSGVDLDYFTLETLPEVEPVTFIMVSRLLGDKGVREYATACRSLKESDITVRCLLVGQLGYSNRSVISESEVRGWQDEGILEYLGEVDDVRPLLARSHVLVLPSYREGMPRTVLEAAAMGRPAIVTDVPGCRHAIESGVTGWLCEVKDPLSLYQQMIECTVRGKGALEAAGAKGRERMEEQFSEEIVVKAYLDCLEDFRSDGSRSSDRAPLLP